MEIIFFVDKNCENIEEKIGKIIHEYEKKESNVFTYIKFDRKPYFVYCRENKHIFQEPEQKSENPEETCFRDSLGAIMSKYIFGECLRILPKIFYIFKNDKKDNIDKSCIISEETLKNTINFCAKSGWKFVFVE